MLRVSLSGSLPLSNYPLDKEGGTAIRFVLYEDVFLGSIFIDSAILLLGGFMYGLS